MDFDKLGTWFTVIGGIVAIIGLFLPSYLSARSSRNEEFRKQSAPMLEKLIDEMEAIEGGSYPLMKIEFSDLKKLLHYTPERRKRALQSAFEQYLNAHSIAVIKHWHDEHPSDGNLFFPVSFIIKNSDEVLKKMANLKKELSR